MGGVSHPLQLTTGLVIKSVTTNPALSGEHMLFILQVSILSEQIILSYIYVELCYSENEIFHIFTYITAAVRQTAKDTEFNYFLSYSTLNCEHFDI